ncbi:hypothetical protein O7747_18065 [Escherichia albertii]|uniref:hypothetical protein n=1 Tax=Escherichia albertii TaxID=208962 RepID=UPI0022B69A31|nr:hypothetical protein [Escherichia albertii]MCZ7518559.1 hypothetical protein [Escherichia albertii]
MSEMNIFVMRAIVIFLMVFSGPARSIAEHLPSYGIWGSNSSSLYNGLSPQRNGIPSPDGKSSVIIHSESISLRINSVITPVNIPFTSGLVDVLWSLDSNSVVITTSDGGFVGTWDAYIISIKKMNKVKVISIRRIVESVLSKKWMCDGEDSINIGAVKWDSELWVIAEVPPHSVCKDMGEIKGIKISISKNKINEMLNDKDVRVKWRKLLGGRFI